MRSFGKLGWSGHEKGGGLLSSLKGTVTDYNQHKELAYRDTQLDLIGDTEILNLTEDMWREYERTELPMTDLCTSVLNQFIPLDEQKIHASLRDKTSSLQLSDNLHLQNLQNSVNGQQRQKLCFQVKFYTVI